MSAVLSPRILRLAAAGLALASSLPFAGAARAVTVSQPYADPQVRDIGLALQTLALVPSLGGVAARPNGIVSFRDGSGLMVLTDLSGFVHQLAPDGTLTPLLDVRALVPTLRQGQEEGLQAAVPHPSAPGLLLTVTTESASPDPGARLLALPAGLGLPIHHYDVISEWDPANGERKVLMVIEQWRRDHNVNQPLCLADGSCLIPVGDGGNTWPSGLVGQQGFGQRLDSPLGTLLRIVPQGDGTYSVPGTNPFANDTDPATLDEIYAYGFRNPQRGYEAADGSLYWIDMGQANAEEINLVSSGGNYGWPLREGHYCVIPSNQALLEDCGPQAGFVDPVAAYDHGVGVLDGIARTAVSGVVVCDGCGIGDLEGELLAVDLNSGALLHPLAGGSFEELLVGGKSVAQLLGLDRVEARLAVDGNGALLLVSRAGRTLYRIAGMAPLPLAPTLPLILAGLLALAGLRSGPSSRPESQPYA